MAKKSPARKAEVNPYKERSSTTKGGNWRNRERKAKYTTAQQGGRSVDVPGLIFATLVVVFVVWPAAQWAFDL